MPKIILVTATKVEIEPTLKFLNEFYLCTNNVYRLNKYDLKVCITNVGMVNTAFELGKCINENYDFAINAGIAGSFGKFNIGELVKVKQDCFCELGAENDLDFLSFDELGFGTQHLKIEYPYENNLTKKINLAKSITVNKIHGNDLSIKKVVEKYQPDIETMEGAAFIFASNSFKWKAVQLRAISNKVEKRNKNNWNIGLAINNLNVALIELIKELAELT